MSSIELLECRIAPAAVFVNATTATYTDADGDLVTVKFTKPVLSTTNIASVLATAAAGAGDQLQAIDLTQAISAAGTGITITAKPSSSAGDGFASVGYIDALGLDLGPVKIHGDVGRIDAGDSNTATLAIKSLAVTSIGFFGTSTQAAGGTLESNLAGGIGAVSITADWANGSLSVTSGNVASITIGGDFDQCSLTTTSNVGAIKIGGSAEGVTLFVGGLAGFSVAHDLSDSSITTSNLTGAGVKIGGELDSSSLTLNGPKEAISVGGAMNQSMVSGSTLTSLTIGGSVTGGAIGANTIGKIAITENLDGSGVLGGGTINAASIQSVTIHGSLIGGGTSDSGFISADSLPSVTISGDIRGGGNAGTGMVTNTGEIQGFSLGSISIGGSIISGVNSGTGSLSESGAIMSDATINSVFVHGSLTGNTGPNGATPVVISAAGPDDTSTKTDVAIKSLTIGGKVTLANILAGYDSQLNAVNADAQIGAVKVSGNWIASNLVAGAENTASSNADFGSGDVKIQGATVTDNPAVLSKIASVIIGGEVTGTAGGSDHFGFVAEQFGSFTVGGTAITLPLAGGTRVLGPTGDVTIEKIL